MSFILLYALTGAFAGLLAGLLGVGGGLVIVPILSWVFAAQHFPDSHILHLALGTSLASIAFTSLSSLRAHHCHGAVDWRVVAATAPGIVLGTLAGSLLVARLSTPFLKGFFVCFELYAGTQMLLNLRPKPSRQLPPLPGMLAAGGIIGGVSSLVGIGGGTLSVPFMTWCNISMHRAIGTSAAIGFPIALAGTAAYIANGLRVANLPVASVGFIYLPALAGLAAASLLTAPLGARLAHRLPVARLKKVFAFLLYILAIRMASDLL